MTEPVRSIVLSGGGARGAYEAGVLAYIYQELPAEQLRRHPIKVFCGTSVGAVHACFLAACAHLPQHHVGRMLELWRGLRLEQLLRLGVRDFARLPRALRALRRHDPAQTKLGLDAVRLQDVVLRDIPWPQIGANLEAGRIDALTVSATHVASGKSMVFVDRPRGGVPAWTRDQRRLARGVRIGPLHALASAAIPLVFPAVSIDGAYYCDGGLRQNTPLSPALRVGADRVLVVAVGQGREVAAPSMTPAAGATGAAEVYPGPTVMLGKVFNALLLDHLDYDLAQLEGFNRLLADGTAAFGPGFVETLSASTERVRGARYRPIDTLVIRPSQDLGTLAQGFVQDAAARLDGLGRWLIDLVAAEDAANNSDLLSYMAFDGQLAGAFIELGMHDAHAARDRLLDFFS